ncbi:MAG TPA: type I methionyl aminopeptidase [Candidatus Eisenbacteria bacterium]|nr:type I methionyl aminopeptidase [Candidatus Eisenbacteria bacterium]
MIRLKTQEEIEIIREGGAILSRILTELVDMARPGVTTGELDAHAEKRMREAGGEPAFKGYRTDPDVRPFASTVCISLDDEVVHAPAVPSRVVPTGSLLKLDIGLKYKGLFTDMAVTVPVGDVTPEAKKLVQVTKESMLAGIAKAVPGNWISEIGKTVDKIVRRNGYTTVKDLVGHGVGHAVHEDPRVPNYFDPELDPVRIKPGMVLAIEPMVNMGEDEVRMKRDGWTVVTADGALSAHYEVTIAITEDGMEIMTPIPENA